MKHKKLIYSILIIILLLVIIVVYFQINYKFERKNDELNYYKAIAKKDVSLCFNIKWIQEPHVKYLTQRIDSRERCITEVAKALEDPKVCENHVFDSFKQNCYGQLESN
jgi:vancomycin permeability regulator SanA